MSENLKLEVVLRQKSVFPKPMPFQTLLGEELSYGTFDGLHLTLGKISPKGFVAYHPEHIARGIRITWEEEETGLIKLFLPIPTCSEEIQDFHEMTLRAMRYWTCSIELNGALMTSNEYKEMLEEMEVLNLRALHEVMKEVLNEETGSLSLSCAYHRLDVGAKEAEEFWSGTTTNAFRDWMHSLQSKAAYIAEPEVLSIPNQEGYTGVYTIPDGVPFVLPKEGQLPLSYYDLETGKPKIEIQEWVVRYYLTEKETLIGIASYQRMLETLPQEKTQDYDNTHYYIEALTQEELEYMASLSDSNE